MTGTPSGGVGLSPVVAPCAELLRPSRREKSLTLEAALCRDGYYSRDVFAIWLRSRAPLPRLWH